MEQHEAGVLAALYAWGNYTTGKEACQVELSELPAITLALIFNRLYNLILNGIGFDFTR
jgi:hypothetical protein